MEHEQLFPGRQTYARYLHVAEAVAEDEAQAAWDGLGGRLKALRREVVDVKAGQAAGQAEVKAKLEAGLAEVKAEMEEVKAGQAEVKAEMKAEMEEVKTGQAEVKALLEKLIAQSL